MKFMLLVCRDPLIAMSPEDRAAMPGLVSAWVEEMEARRIRLQGDVFEPASAAETVRVRGDKRQVVNGPFADTAEQISGFNIIQCDDLEQAVEVAAKHPILRFGSIEVRPFAAG